MDEVKQVIVMRSDLGMRKGKMIAQGAHAAMMFLVSAIKPYNGHTGYTFTSSLSPEAIQWLDGDFTKIVVRVDSLEELENIFLKAEENGIIVHKCTDLGKTEFHGIPTTTCIAIGPDVSSKLDDITGHLPLY